jgi:hypothetical protein
MDDRLGSLEKNVARLVDAVERLERRLAVLETGAAPERGEPKEQLLTAAASVASEERSTLDAAATASRILSLVGRSLLVLAGAFLLRAVTDAGTVPTSVGIGLGFAYAAVWLAAARTAARSGRRRSAIFHGVCSSVIGYPLIWEAATTFKVLSPEGAVLGVAGVTGVGLVIAWGCGLRSVAWVFTVAAVATTVALVTVSPITAVAGGFLVLLGLVTFWVARSRDWFLLPWLPALVADVSVMRAVGMTTAPVDGSVSVSVAWLLVAVLVVGYVGTVAIQVLARRRPIDVFDVIQTTLALAVGVAAVERLAVGSVFAGAAVVFAGAACYAAAFAVVERQSESGRNFVYVSTLAVALLLIGSSYLGGELIVATVWAALGLLSAFLGSRLGRRRCELRWWFRLPLVALVVISAAGLCAEVVRLLASPSLFDIGSAGGLAMARTGVVSVGTLLLAALATRLQIPELRWVVYPILCALGLKILLQDLPAGRPLSIAVAFVFYGAALIVSPRLLRTHDRQATAPDSPNAAERLDSGHAPS